jgi:1,4-dihydroxy-2-naphthoyl-CoA synthase
VLLVQKVRACGYGQSKNPQVDDSAGFLSQERFHPSPRFFQPVRLLWLLELDGQRGLMEFAGDATLLYYLTEEAQEGKKAFLEKRDPDFQQFPKFP